MTRLLLILAVLACPASSFARSLVLTLSDGSTASYQLGGASNPVVMTLASDGVRIKTDAFTFEALRSYVISEQDVPDAINADRNAPALTIRAGHITAEAVAFLYTVSGRLVAKGRDINLNTLPAGAYVATAAGHSLKFSWKGGAR